MTSSDEQQGLLVRQAAQELPYRRVAFEQLALRLYPQIYRLALGVTRNTTLAENVGQDVLIRVMNGLPGLEDPDRFQPWLYRIILNVANTWLAREQREREKASRLGDEYDPLYQPGDLSRHSFAEMLEPLNAEERTIVSLKILDDFEFREIADITGMSLSAVKMRYYRALEKVEKTLD